MCIYYPLHFWKDTKGVRDLIDWGSKVNVITLAYVAILGLKVQETNIRAQKVDGSTLDIFEMVLADFHVENKLGKAWFFQETFLVANTT